MDGRYLRIAGAVATAVLLGTVAAGTVPTGQAGGAAAAPRLRPPVQYHRTISTSALGVRAARRLRRATWAGGSFTTGSGERVTVYVSTTYADANSIGRWWADFVGALVHGHELSLARLYVAPLAEVEAFCGADDVLGCYGQNTLVSIGERADDVTPEEVVRHEYGHHVAANRQNAPWNALDWGTKRWATHAGVCTRVGSGTAFPGDEDFHYTLNPGEAFAEAYRALNEIRGGASAFAWTLVDASFAPDSAALAAVDQDVRSPWAQPASRTIGRRFAPRARSWSTRLLTPLDGMLELTLAVPRGTAHTVELLDAGAVVARGLWSGSGTQTLRHQICGTRAFTVRVRVAGAPRRFTLRTAIP